MIPVKNIFYLLSYYWSKLDSNDVVNLSESDYSDLLNLFARVLINGTQRMLKQGLNRDYLEHHEEYSGIKGKIDFATSLRQNSFSSGLAYCYYDEYTSNILKNQILKSTLRRLLRCNSLDRQLKADSRNLIERMADIDEVHLTKRVFNSVHLSRNDLGYDLLLRVSELIYNNTVFDDSTGDLKFIDFTRDERVMAYVFEGFVREFYLREQDEFRVRREDIYWSAKSTGGDKSYLPKMQTDITLESPSRKVVIETKYYLKTLTDRYGKFNSSNLYQLYSYLKNLENNGKNTNDARAEGVLLYPTTNYSLDESFVIDSHHIKVCTVDLSKSWRSIHNRLLNILISPGAYSSDHS